jgi:hypothetical protein
LIGESEGGKGGGLELGGGSREDVQTGVTHEELDILQAEGGGVGGSVGVFARAEEEEEGQDNHVSHRAKGGISAREPGKMSYPAKNLDGDRFDTIWSRISFLPRCPSPL